MRSEQLKLIKKIRLHTEAGTILNHMYLLDELEQLLKCDIIK